MEKLNQLEKKIANKVDDDYISTEQINHLKLNSQIDAVYKLVNNTTRRIERQLGFVEAKQNKILELLGNKELDPKQIEILELENRLKELREES